MARAASDETDAVSYTEARTGMSARSSSGSWPGRGERAADIIDLDRYMRGSVRPHNRHHPDDSNCDRLVVDAGGAAAVPGGPVGVPLGGPRVGSVAGSVRVVASSRPAKSSSTTSAPRDKRYSHDSGLSDGSYVRRRTHRRAMGETATLRAHRDREQKRERTGTSSNSMRTFRVACERALRDQQEQIARVAQLCERLTVNNERGGGAAVVAQAAVARKPSASGTQDSSDISSSSISRSTRDKSRRDRDRDKHRSNECKTYKIIMNKLDELNRLFMARARSTPPARRAVPPPRASSGGSVSVSDKLVCTEPQDRHHGRAPRSVAAYAMTADVRPVLVSPRAPQSVAHSTIHRRSPPNLVERGVGGGERGGRAALGRLAAARAHELDIAPVEPPPHAAHPPHPPRAPPKMTRSGWLNVGTESVEYDSDGDGSTAQAPHCKFDLDNPLHLYYQAKRLQNSQKQRARAHSLGHDDARIHSSEKSHNHYISLCGRCQNYWRALMALATQLFTVKDKEPDIC